MCNPDHMQMREILLLIGVVAGITVATATAFRRLRRIPAASGAQPERDDPGREEIGCEVPDLNELLRRTLRRDLSLAGEHVHSIRWLLEIARQHQQPIPPAVLTNLDLVGKHLAKMQRRIETAVGEAASEAAVNAFAHHRETQYPLDPRPPSFECHVSPFDRSAPCD